jgi:nitrite reductase/ring-hydroxylating ferredoxin subunit
MTEGGEWLPLCELDELPQRGCREFRYRRDGEVREGFLVRLGDTVYAYRNSCPHLLIPMNWLPDVLLDDRRRYIHCALHGALFEIETGECIKGPCFGRFLEHIPAVLEAGQVLIAGLSHEGGGDRWREKLLGDGDSFPPG